MPHTLQFLLVELMRLRKLVELFLSRDDSLPQTLKPCRQSLSLRMQLINSFQIALAVPLQSHDLLSQLRQRFANRSYLLD